MTGRRPRPMPRESSDEPVQRSYFKLSKPITFGCSERGDVTDATLSSTTPHSGCAVALAWWLRTSSLPSHVTHTANSWITVSFHHIVSLWFEVFFFVAEDSENLVGFFLGNGNDVVFLAFIVKIRNYGLQSSKQRQGRSPDSFWGWEKEGMTSPYQISDFFKVAGLLLFDFALLHGSRASAKNY